MRGRYWWGLGVIVATGCMAAGPPERPGGPTPDRRYINPGTMAGLDGFTHAVKVGTTVYVSGEVALDSLGQLVGPGDLKAQAAQAFANLSQVLRIAGADVDQVHALLQQPPFDRGQLGHRITR